jgi:hypothetical protein
MEYIESIGFTAKILNFFLLKSCFSPVKSENSNIYFRWSRAVAAAVETTVLHLQSRV